MREAAVGDEDERAGEADRDDGVVARVQVAEQRSQVEDGAPQRKELGEEEQRRRTRREAAGAGAGLAVLVAAATRTSERETRAMATVVAQRRKRRVSIAWQIREATAVAAGGRWLRDFYLDWFLRATSSGLGIL